MHKIILTDIDGVVLDWQTHFNDYLDKYYPGQELFDPTVFAQGEEKTYLILPTNFETRNASDRYYSSEEQENFLTYILRAEELINKILTKQD